MTISESDHISEYQRQGREKAEKERGSVGNPADDQEQLLQWAESGEDGAAKIFVNKYRGRFCFDHAKGCWYQFSEHHWRPCEIDEQLARVGDLIEIFIDLGQRWHWRKLAAVKGGNEKDAKRAERVERIVEKQITNLRRRRFRQDVLILAAAGENSLGISGRQWDCNPMLVPFRNGVLDLVTATFRAGRPGDYVKTFCPVDWLGFDVPCPRWEKFISEILNDHKELVGYLKRLLGSGISGKIYDHVLIILWGVYGRNGKTVLCEILAYVMGELYTAIPGDFLLAQKFARSSAAPSPDIMSIMGRRYVVASETGEGRALDAARVKLFTGGDRLVGRGPYDKRMITFRPSHSLLMLTNFRPKINPRDRALWQRIHILKFDISFVDSPKEDYERLRNPNLAEELKTEASGILSWLVAGFFEWQEKGLAPPPEVLETIQEYKNSEDSISQFIEECCIVADEGLTVRASKLQEEYVEFCKEEGLKAVGKNNFGKCVHLRFEQGRDSKGKYFKGLGLKYDTE